jgi:hypothetical protein
VPFYTEQKKIGMSKGVSMKSALIEQGFAPQGMKLNQLVMWENSELEVMEDILNGRGIERNIIGATHAHKSVPQYKESQDWRKLPRRKKNMSTWEVLENDLRVTREKNSLLQVENDKLLNEKHSEWKSFYFSDPDKHTFVQNRLAELGIPFRENEQGFESQQCYVERIRQIEKQYKSEPTSHRDVLRDLIDKIAMQADSYDEIFATLKRQGYQIKHGKYTAVKPPNGTQFIRIKSLGEYYNEQALRNRIDNRNRHQNQIEQKLKSFSETGNSNVLEYRLHATIHQYVITFKHDLLPARKVRPKQPFSFVNDVELDRLAALNKKINAGATLISLRNDFARLEKSVTEKESRLTALEKELNLFTRLQKSAALIFERNDRNPNARKFLAENGVTAENYQQIAEIIDTDTSEIDVLEQSLSTERAKLKDTSESLTAFERIMSMTFVDNLVIAEKDRRQSAIIGNGVKSADMNMGESMRIDKVAAKVAKVVEPPPVYKPKRK